MPESGDLPPIILTDDYVKTDRLKCLELPDRYRKSLTTLALNLAVIEDIIAVPEKNAIAIKDILDKSDQSARKRARILDSLLENRKCR